MTFQEKQKEKDEFIQHVKIIREKFKLNIENEKLSIDTIESIEDLLIAFDLLIYRYSECVIV